MVKRKCEIGLPKPFRAVYHIWVLRAIQMGLKKAQKILVFKVNVKYHLRGLNVDVMMNI